MALLFLSITLLTQLSTQQQQNPFNHTGPYPIDHYDDSYYIQPYENLSYALSIYSPTTPATYPIILFYTGFEGVAPSLLYSNILHHISSYGYIIVSASILNFNNATISSNNLIQLIYWLNNNLINNLILHNINNVIPNYNQFILSGQSSGCHGIADVINTNCMNITSILFIDPVDCSSPEVPKGCLTKIGKKLDFEIPMLHIETGLDPVSNNKLFPPCAPKDMSNERWVNAWNGPIYEINATKYGHMDCGDDIFMNLFDIVCPSCESEYGKENCDSNEYKNGIGGWVVSFLKLLYEQDQSYQKYLIDPSYVTIDVIMKQYNLNNYTFQPFCKNLES